MTYAQARLDAKRQGALENAKKVASSLYKAGMSLDFIAKIVEYSEKEIAGWLGLMI